MRGLAPSDRLLTHCSVVGEISAFLCAAMARRGVAVDTSLTEAAGFLHDLDKALAKDDPLRALGHGPAGAEWLRLNGNEELGEAIAEHPVSTLGEAESYEEWAARLSLEARVVTFADKRALQDVVSLDKRFARWHRRYPDSEMLAVAHERARLLERDVCAAAGIRPDEVKRLPWVDAALGEAA